MRRLVHRLRSRGGERPDSLNAASQNNPQSRINTAREESSNRPRRPNVSLHDAASKGLTEIVLCRLEEGVPIHKTNNDGATALHLAIIEGHVDTARLLLERKANVEAPYGVQYAKPVHLAAMALNPAMMETLLKYRPNLESRLNGLTALFFAISAGDETVVRLLLEAGADARARTLCEVGTGESVLHMAVGWFRNSMLPILIRYGADVNVAGTNPMGQRALHIAAEYGNTEAVEELIKSGTDINAKFPGGETALVVAAREGQVDAASALINHGMDPLACFDGKQTAVFMAVVHGRTEMVRYFLHRYADRIDRRLQLQLVIGAAATNRVEILKMLDEREFPMLGIDDAGVGALFPAILYKHKDAVVYLLRRGADPDPHIPRDPNSWAATEEGHLEINKLLREAKAQRGVRPASELFPEWRYRDEDNSSSTQAKLMAGVVSLYATRRIQVNQEPAGVFCCRICHDLDFRRGMPPDAEIVYFTGVEAMESAAATGCRGCRFLSDCLTQARKAYGAALWDNFSGNGLVLYSMAQGAPLLFHLKTSNVLSIPPIPSKQIEIYVKEGTGATWATVGTGRDVSLPGWPEERVNIAKRLLHECTTNHTHCPYIVGELPTRVIRTSTPGQPQLYLSKGERAKYVALSHCWGGVSPLTTTTSTLSQRRQEIPFADLPRTFQDAVTITRSLGVEYLWIDSLCIIQDDKDDWTREAARMKSVYTGCYAMIAADNSINPHGGCFSSSVNEKTRSYAVESVGPFLGKAKAFIRLTHLRDPFHEKVSHNIGDVSQEADKSRTILNQRGWCFQERVLAPRILHLGKSELAWECPETVACECQCVTTSLDKGSRFKALFADSILRSAQSRREAGSAGEQVDILLWMYFVEEFTQRKLTNSTDTLHALSGLAEFMAAAAQTEYMCGLWRRKLDEFLLWHVDNTQEDDWENWPAMTPRPFRSGRTSLQFSPLPSERTRKYPMRSRRHASYHAPSWSWASVIGPIGFLLGRLDTRAGDQLSHVRKDGALAKSTTRRSLLETVDVHYATKSLNPFGPPNEGASLTVLAPTLPVMWTGKRDPSDPMLSYRTEHVVTYTPGPSGTASSFTADFQPDFFDGESSISIGDWLLLLFVTLDNEAVVPHLNNAMVGVKCKVAMGLVLAPGPSAGAQTSRPGAPSVYRRVGLFSVNDNEWRDVQSKQTVTIV